MRASGERLLDGGYFKGRRARLAAGRGERDVEIMAVKLTHIGERLVQAMAKADLDRFYKRCGLKRYAGADWEVEIELKLAPWAGRAFDPVSKVDLGIRLDESSVVPVEIKLGRGGLGTSAVGQLLKSWDQSKHPDPRWSGSMMAILDRRFPEQAVSVGSWPEDLRAEVGGRSFTLEEEWIVIARRNVIASWQKASPFRKARFVPFEDLARDLGVEDFNRIVTDLLPDNFYQEWIEGVG